MTKYHITLFLFLASISCQAQNEPDSLKNNQLNMSINFLSHGELCGGGLPRAGDGTNKIEDRSSFLFGRTRIILDYQRKGLQAYAVLQNKAVWGMKGNQTLNLYEGWVKMNAKNGLFAQLGRVALSYDDERIIGTNDFATAALSHDVARVGYEGNGHKAHAILAYNQNGDNVYSGTYYEGGAQLYKTMITLWYHYDLKKIPLGASLLFMNLGQQCGVQGDPYNPPSTKYQQMFGAYLKYQPKLLSLEASYYRQTGKVVNVSMQAGPIRAWMASVKAIVKPTDKFGFQLGYDYLSGDEYVPVVYGGTLGLVWKKAEGGFAPLYGSRTKFYGIMDYFYESAYINGFTPGLQNAFAGVYYKPNGKLSCALNYHYLAVATKLKNLDRTLGHSIDLQAKYQFTKDIALSAGYTQMSGTETMNRLKQGNGDKKARWAWFSLVVSPRIFTTKW